MISLLKVAETAKILRMNRQTLYRLAKQKGCIPIGESSVPVIIVGSSIRFDANVLNQALEGNVIGLGAGR